MTERIKIVDMIFGLMRHRLKNACWPFPEPPILEEITAFLLRCALENTMCALDRKTLVDLGYDDKNLTEDQIKDMALDINLTQAFESEVGRVVGKYGLKKSIINNYNHEEFTEKHTEK